jgi:hypothetical protein
VLRLALIAALTGLVAFATSASADGSLQFTFGRVIHTTPDRQGRIGLRSSCAAPGGCKINYSVKRGTRFLGGTQALLLANTTQTDYVTFTKSTAAALRKQRWRVTITADASDPQGNRATVTKIVTLGPAKKTKR